MACSSQNKIRKGYPDCNSNDIEMMDTCLIGKPLKYALQKLNIDTSSFLVYDEPPGYFNAIVVDKGDSLKMRIGTTRLILMDSITGIIPLPVSKTVLNDQLITSVSWLKPYKKRNGHVGKGILYWQHEIRR